LLSPAAFLQRPISWLQAISAERGTITGAPNFAYELCVAKSTAEDRAGLNLSSLRLALCAAEPIRADSLARFSAAFADCGFRQESFYPCYGLAESTLLAAGNRGPGKPTLQTVSRAALANHRVEPAALGESDA